jgi:flagellar biosynthetic protein FlhB
VAKGEDKTEQPTARRLREARKEGRLPHSMEVPQALTLAASIFIIPTLIPKLQRTLVDGWRRAMGNVDVTDPGPALGELGRLVTSSLMLLGPLLLAIIICAVGARALLGGIHFNFHHIKPKPKQFNPFTGLKNLFSIRQFGTLFRLVLKVGALAGATYLLWDGLLASALIGPADLFTTISSIGGAIHTFLIAVLAISVVAGGLDGGMALRRYRKDLRMSKQEVREDAKQTESNPMLKQEIRARQRKMSRLRMMADVARADVILTNPTHLAVALCYEAGSPAPKVVAKGADHMAMRIRKVALEHNVPIQENKPLARALYSSVEIGDVIPVHLYQAVAEILATVYRAARRLGPAVSPATTVDGSRP